MTDEWTQPDLPFEGGLPADSVKLKELVGCAVLVAVGGCHASVPTKFDPKPAVRVCLVVLNGPHAGQEYVDVLLFNAQPVRKLRGVPGRAFVGHVDIDDVSAANPAPLLLDPSPEEYELAAKWHAQNPSRTAELVEIAVDVFNAFEVNNARPQQQSRPPVQYQRSTPPSAPPPAPRSPQLPSGQPFDPTPPDPPAGPAHPGELPPF
jgi:hypothetical protein